MQHSQSPSYFSAQQRQANAEEKKKVQDHLILYYKSLVFKLLNTTAHGEVKALTTLKFMLGFSKYQIGQVVENMEAIYSLSDVYKFVEIWDKRHAMKILSVINDVFNDGNTESTSEDNEYDFDEEFLDEWQEVLQDDDFFDMVFDNLSLSQLENSFQDNENASSDSQEMGVPSAVLATVEAMHLNDQF